MYLLNKIFPKYIEQKLAEIKWEKNQELQVKVLTNFLTNTINRPKQNKKMQ